ncbi:hypothetical protein GH714_039662 [Hevea brasiliensis]|uniref:Uncharacterized protein n=1 Tax=Hevea brasiliensis TaxID=3981 RepID=A0A6A6K4Q3_HEVBR|nr:hypothetical protein GH714_015084 [Hevea brasiliensis]KAF2290003.1 hypothetical protein GH714_039662 [Hevea brasiliensis]
MRDDGGDCTKFVDTGSSMPRSKLGNITHSDPNMSATIHGEVFSIRNSSASAAAHGFFDPNRLSCEGSPMTMSPWNNTSAFNKTEWTPFEENAPQNGLIGSLVREEGHIYSLAAIKDILYTGSDSKNIRVWKDLKEFSGFKSSSGLVKAIIILGEKIFTGHQDGKIRVWKVSPKNPSIHKRSGTLPTLKDIFKSSIKPSNYVQVRNHRTALWIKHSDAVSCLSFNEDHTLFDGVVNFWEREKQLSHGGVLKGHKLAVLCLSSAGNLVFSGSADKTICVWRREGTIHTCLSVLSGHNGPVKCLAVEEDRERSKPGDQLWVVYSGSLDKSVKVWSVSELAPDVNHMAVMQQEHYQQMPSCSD